MLLCIDQRAVYHFLKVIGDQQFSIGVEVIRLVRRKAVGQFELSGRRNQRLTVRREIRKGVAAGAHPVDLQTRHRVDDRGAGIIELRPWQAPQGMYDRLVVNDAATARDPGLCTADARRQRRRQVRVKHVDVGVVGGYHGIGRPDIAIDDVHRRLD